MKRKIISFVLAALLLTGAIPVRASADTWFYDVPAGAWYSEYIDTLVSNEWTSGIISGYGDGTFRPENTVKRGEFLKLIFEAAGAQGNSTLRSTTSRDNIHWAGKYYTMAMDNNILVSDVYTGGVMFQCTYQELEKPISRYEAAVILANMCTNVARERTVIVEDAASYIPDYYSIPGEYVTLVEQSYGKGLLKGDGSGSFNGYDTLRRCEAAAIIYRFLWDGQRTMPDWASEPVVNGVYVSSDFVPFAVQYQSMSESERRIALFGNANKSYFANSAEAAPYMRTVSVPIWIIDQYGNKVSSTTSVTVHYLVATEVQLIFQEIYNDPEQFPIYGGWSIGGSRYSDTMRHAWGCAIDINAFYNCECTTNWNTGNTRVTCGYGWWPEGTAWTTFAGSMGGPSPYSINAGGSVVRAFAKYGWGWGGNGYSVKSDGSQKFDYMHFSILSSGG